MTLRNTEYRITFRSAAGRLYYTFAKDRRGWYQLTAAGNRHPATAEQVLNHLLPALAEVQPGVRLKPKAVVTVQYAPEGPVLPSTHEVEAPDVLVKVIELELREGIA
jgi:hypothetical protein